MTIENEQLWKRIRDTPENINSSTNDEMRRNMQAQMDLMIKVEFVKIFGINYLFRKRII